MQVLDVSIAEDGMYNDGALPAVQAHRVSVQEDTINSTSSLMGNSGGTGGDMAMGQVVAIVASSRHETENERDNPEFYKSEVMGGDSMRPENSQRSSSGTLRDSSSRRQFTLPVESSVQSTSILTEFTLVTNTGNPNGDTSYAANTMDPTRQADVESQHPGPESAPTKPLYHTDDKRPLASKCRLLLVGGILLVVGGLVGVVTVSPWNSGDDDDGRPTDLAVAPTTPMLTNSVPSAPVSYPAPSPTIPFGASTNVGSAPTEFDTLEQIVSREEDVYTFSEMIRGSKFVTEPCQECYFTYLAPTNKAFDGFPLLEYIGEQQWNLHFWELLLFHQTVPAAKRVRSTDWQDGTVLKMGNGDDVTVRIDGGNVVFVGDYSNATTRVKSDISVSNGVLHKLNSVLIPEFMVTDLLGVGKSTYGTDFTILAKLCEHLNTDISVYGQNVYTMFAPTDDAFRKLGNETLDYLFDQANVDYAKRIFLNHVTDGLYPSSLLDGTTLSSEAGTQLSCSTSDDGRTLVVNGTSIVRVDILVQNGIVHAISEVLGV
jgi:uncharacterized surface protein with fasciclin (FAS1) repeats